LTSQIFANIYLNQFDRFVRQQCKLLAYVRYGDDCLMFAPSEEQAKVWQARSMSYLLNELHLTVHARNNVIVQANRGLHFLGMHLYPNGHALAPKAFLRTTERTSQRNYSSYHGLIVERGNRRQQRLLLHEINELMI
jgi:hypothetical protein